MKKLLKNFILMVLLFAAIPATVFLYLMFEANRYFFVPEERTFNTKLKNALEQNTPTIPVRSLTNFEWGEACIYLSYSSLNPQMKKVDGLMLKGRIPNLESDGAWALLFKNEKEGTAQFVEIRSVTFSRKLRLPYCFNRSSTMHIVQEKYKSHGEVYFYKTATITN